MTESSAPIDIPLEPLRKWLADALGQAVTSVAVSEFPGGRSGGALKVDLDTDGTTRAAVLKAPEPASPTYQRDIGGEAAILQTLHARGLRVPKVLATDTAGDIIGRPCFVMEYVDASALTDSMMSGIHEDEWLIESGPDVQRAVWESFVSLLATIHAIGPEAMPAQSSMPRGMAAVLDYWQDSITDVVPAAAAPRQLGLIESMRRRLPADADDDLTMCLGDARIANCLFNGADATALIDFEAAHVANPAADLGYLLLFERQHRANAANPLPGIPTADETWARWESETGRTVADKDYWVQLGAAKLCITATRAMVLQWGMPIETIEEANPALPLWEELVGVTDV